MMIYCNKMKHILKIVSIKQIKRGKLFQLLVTLFEEIFNFFFLKLEKRKKIIRKKTKQLDSKLLSLANYLEIIDAKENWNQK